MRPDDLRDLLRQQPFCPLRLHLTTGEVFEVRHPELAQIARSIVRLDLPPESGAERRAVIGLLHIVWVEVLVPG
jgi:hypothetical protein